MRVLFYSLCVIAGLAAFLIACWLGSSGNLWAALVPFVISTLGMGLVRIFAENGSPAGIYHPSTQSWAFLFGDAFALPFTYAMLALGWRSISTEDWRWPVGWLVILCLVIGILVGAGWHYALDGPGYIEQGYADLLGSPSKIWHDFVVYGSISGSLIFLGLPVLSKDFMGFGWLAVAGLVVWGLLGLADNTVHKLDPANLHPPQSETILR